ncbi:flagellar protein FlgN [Marinococcus sp. PL1-022]|uniref:flagellar protein FlgN n=1 Tax=Marinococcus sp. PL1-022 TaxID=3095363 RepID=UPI0029C3BAD7|nr:flagellar protein FlgN [Marinococcus sp. PL1-022]MDX6151702.1 flagellar protein FlgN [Marinococcus sp. PL1-022]
MSVQIVVEQLGALIEEHRLLLDMSERKTQVLKKNDAEALQQLVRDERRQVQRITRIERERHQQAAALAGSNPEDAVSIDALKLLADDKERARLEALQYELIQLMTALQHQEELNRAILEDAMKYTQVMLGAMQPQESAQYGRQGLAPQRTKREYSVFDSRA